MKQSVAGILYHKGLFLVGLRLPGGEMGNRWEFPGGKVDDGETPQEALIREFKEEMNMDITVQELITTVQFTNKGGQSLLLAYAVKALKDTSLILSEHKSVSWASFEEIKKLPFVDSDSMLFSAIEAWLH